MTTRLAESPGRPLERHGNVSPREMTVHGAHAPGQNPAYRPAHSPRRNPEPTDRLSSRAHEEDDQDTLAAQLRCPQGRGQLQSAATFLGWPSAVMSCPGGNPCNRHERNSTSRKHQRNSRQHHPRPPTKQRDGCDKRSSRRHPQHGRRYDGRITAIADEAVSGPGVGEDAHIRSRRHGNGPDQHNSPDRAKSHDRRPDDQVRRGSFCGQLPISYAHALIVRTHRLACRARTHDSEENWCHGASHFVPAPAP